MTNIEKVTQQDQERDEFDISLKTIDHLDSLSKEIWHFYYQNCTLEGININDNILKTIQILEELYDFINKSCIEKLSNHNQEKDEFDIGYELIDHLNSLSKSISSYYRQNQTLEGVDINDNILNTIQALKELYDFINKKG